LTLLCYETILPQTVDQFFPTGPPHHPKQGGDLW
jgi:hypothetical protein